MTDNCRGLVRLIHDYSSISGSTGPTGDQGPIGEMGLQGITGTEPRGDRGEIGDPGPQGDQGPTGDTGPIGPQGDTGSIYNISDNSSQITIQPSEIESISINVHPRDIGWLSRTNVDDYRGLGSTDWQSNSVLIGDYSGIGSGLENINTGSMCTVSGGIENQVEEGRYNSMNGGCTNRTEESDGNLIGGGISNTAVKESTILGGTSNRSYDNSTIVGGTYNIIQREGHVTIVGGYRNIARRYSRYGLHRTTIWGGVTNSTTITHPCVLGGRENSSNCRYGNVLGGYDNSSGSIFYSESNISVGGGQNNYIDSGHGIIAGGEDNRDIGSSYNTIIGGRLNWAAQLPGSTNLTIFGGSYSRSYAESVTTFGGQNNYVAGKCSDIIGGIDNATPTTITRPTRTYVATIGGQGLRSQRDYSILAGHWNTHLDENEVNNVISDAMLTVGRGTISTGRSILCLTSEGDLHIAGSHQSGAGNDYSETFWSETNIQPGTPVVMNSNGLVSEYVNQDPELIIGVVSIMSAIIVNSEGMGTLVRRDSNMRPIQKSSDIIQPNNRYKIIVGMIGQVYVRDQYLTQLPTRWRILHESSKLCDGMTLVLIR